MHSIYRLVAYKFLDRFLADWTQKVRLATVIRIAAPVAVPADATCDTYFLRCHRIAHRAPLATPETRSPRTTARYTSQLDGPQSIPCSPLAQPALILFALQNARHMRTDFVKRCLRVREALLISRHRLRCLRLSVIDGHSEPRSHRRPMRLDCARLDRRSHIAWPLIPLAAVPTDNTCTGVHCVLRIECGSSCQCGIRMAIRCSRVYSCAAHG